jgi:hypothetical protein
LPLRVEIAAAEPDVIDPVAAVFDEAEQLWVVEMGDYPLGPKPGEAPRGGSSCSTTRTATGGSRCAASSPTDCFFRRRGAVAARPPRHDDAADPLPARQRRQRRDGHEPSSRRRIPRRELQLLPNHPTWSIDNGFYVANGLRATDVRVPLPQGTTQLEIRGRDLRIDPTTWQAEAASGGSQFVWPWTTKAAGSSARTETIFSTSCSEDRYARRNPRATLPTTVEAVPDHGPAARIFPLSQNWTTSNLHAGTFTAACGVHVYRGDRMPALRGDAFVCDPTGNLVHRDRLQYLGSTFAASRAAEDKDAELLRSPSEWFRPVNVTSGPDGVFTSSISAGGRSNTPTGCRPSKSAASTLRPATTAAVSGDLFPPNPPRLRRVGPCSLPRLPTS